VAVASAGPYASLYCASDRQPCQHLSQTCELSYYLLGKILPEIFLGIFFTASNDETLTDPDGSKQLSELADER